MLPSIDQLQRRLADLEQLTYRSAHDLKGPLVTIAGFLKGLSTSAKAGRWDEFDTDVTHITRMVGHMQQQLEDLLQLARLDQPLPPPRPLSIPKLVRDAAVLLEAILIPRRLIVNIDEDAPLIAGQETQLVAVFENLFRNASQSTSSPEFVINVTVDDSQENDHLIVRVRDFGIGIPLADRERVFEPFVRLEGRELGTGLGLCIVKHTVDRHGGRVWIESPPSAPGTVVCLALPKANPQERVP